MTNYEFMRWATFFIMPTHLVTVRNDIKRLINTNKQREALSILDVGGRKSPYTINLPAEITLLDVPQESGTREALNLGFTNDILATIQKKRSNIKDVVIQDMTKSTLADASYGAVVCIEVIEHVVEDDIFVKNISKVIKKGGWAYFTTPNGDYIKNEGPHKNPDHVRHYTKDQLQALLEKYFDSVDVHYAVKTGKYRVQGLKSFSLRRPLSTFKSIYSNIVNRFQSQGVQHISQETAHLIAIGYK
ncbi:bifunctional 2-polyprenyl-6-hydroxyphenol methylase/3-demethylubiquinol 3-O-methyltransferase UbiG [Psychroserpens sp. SPM9]|uniref:class I SAM-dependent methyltransferase n=1 Tax=Psychroserpens sp. SPM9 TaxID=2975598 RepID=UPI0021A42C26|nr:class I SAM-dependent methyltransferase [Psychroserpens sp. SPM9]MDG5492232.1 class I SAM-dependent methyltransferase [Psychroserpens sp. SPM9]